MKAQHTPGPWEAQTNRSPLTITHELPHLPQAKGGHRQFREIAEVYVSDKGDGAPEDFANAALIAAAPELLAALKAILARVESGEGMGGKFLGGPPLPIREARAAIAKAGGGK